MARFSSRSRRNRRGRRLNSIVLGAVVVVFGLIVFLMFRDDSPGPQEASARNETANPSSTNETNRAAPPQLAAVETNRPSGQAAPRQEALVEPEPAVTPVQRQAEPAVVPVQAAPVATQPAAAPNARVEAIIAEGAALLESQPRKVIAARDKFNEAMSLPMSAQQRHLVKQRLTELSEEWLFGPAAFPGDPLCDNYTVQRGDLLQVIGNKHKVPYEVLMRINNIRRPETLQAGKTIKVLNGPFHAKVYRSTFTLDLYLQDTFVRSFKVGLGAPDSPTPTGLWRVQAGGRLIQPEWTDERANRTYKPTDPDYPLGSRWIALDGLEGAARGRTGFAIHGTKDPHEIGMDASQGCIRMHNGDAILVYDCLFPLHSRVEVVD